MRVLFGRRVKVPVRLAPERMVKVFPFTMASSKPLAKPTCNAPAKVTAPVAVLIVTADAALSEVWMEIWFATAAFAVGVNTSGLAPLNVPPLVAAVETVTSLAARRCCTGRRNETQRTAGRSRVFMARSVRGNERGGARLDSCSCERITNSKSNVYSIGYFRNPASCAAMRQRKSGLFTR